jgi:hypothetical protein
MTDSNDLDHKDPRAWKKGDPPIDIGWEDEVVEAPRELSPDEKILHDANMAKLNRIMRSYGILKVGLSALLVVVVIKFFGH